MDPCPFVVTTDLELPELPNTASFIIHSHLELLTHVEDTGKLWTQRICEEIHSRLCHWPFFSLVHLYTLVVSLFNISMVVARYSLDDHLEFPCYLIMCKP